MIAFIIALDALKRSLAVANQIGIVAVIVDAKDEKAVAFYKDYGFTAFPDNHRRLFLSLSTIKKLVYRSWQSHSNFSRKCIFLKIRL